MVEAPRVAHRVLGAVAAVMMIPRRAAPLVWPLSVVRSINQQSQPRSGNIGAALEFRRVNLC